MRSPARDPPPSTDFSSCYQHHHPYALTTFTYNEPWPWGQANGQEAWSLSCIGLDWMYLNLTGHSRDIPGEDTKFQWIRNPGGIPRYLRPTERNSHSLLAHPLRNYTSGCQQLALSPGQLAATDQSFQGFRHCSSIDRIRPPVKGFPSFEIGAALIFFLSLILFAFRLYLTKKNKLAEVSVFWARFWKRAPESALFLSIVLSLVATVSVTLTSNAVEYATSVPGAAQVILAGQSLQALQWISFGISIVFVLSMHRWSRRSGSRDSSVQKPKPPGPAPVPLASVPKPPQTAGPPPPRPSLDPVPKPPSLGPVPKPPPPSYAPK
ncbi:hypothetical protein QBC37DRAFT_488244 [Rhypophila decipiens]|uniref:Uncharacterized protein n=1 Tax=Rhypophila decipiens TaxID=261697 RepID=A0AAN6XT29_9PEZI|nr:hypothetical protein QBC37DRAFT_488244 [Rhypophila decipiens]